MDLSIQLIRGLARVVVDRATNNDGSEYEYEQSQDRGGMHCSQTFSSLFLIFIACI